MSALGSGLLTFALVLLVLRRPGRSTPARRWPLGRWSDRAPARPGPGAGRRWAVVVVVAGGGLIVALLLEPQLVAVLALGALGARAMGRASSARAVARARARAVPELVDLFAIAASAGLPVAGALGVVAVRSPLAVRPLVTRAEERRARGLPIDRSLAQLSDDLGPAALPLVDALRRSVASGAPLAPMLVEVAAGSREARRRAAEASARRLPVAMLLPLAGCILPAAVLLAVVPVVVVSISALAR